MRRALLSVCAGLVLAAAPAAAQTVDEIIAKNLQAKGGLDRLKAVNTLRMTGSIALAPGVDAPFVMEFKRPNQMRMDVTIRGETVTSAYDGNAGWTVNPAMGITTPQPIPPDGLRQVEAQADFDGPFVDPAAKGHKIELLGKQVIDGTDAYGLKVTFKSGDVRYYYLSAARFLEIRIEGQASPGGMPMTTESTVGDYRDENGILMPHVMESGVKGNPQRQKMVVQKVEMNVPIDDARFKRPR
jgi:outer membrane lipoprotein-sorting protein